MKKVLFVSALFILAASTKSFAQDATGAWGGKGTKVVNVGYGFGSIWKTLFKLSGSTVKSTGPIALGFEYGVAEKIGVGLQLGYGQIKATSGSGSSTVDQKLTSFQAFARGNYHFGDSEKFDPYIGVGLGYGNFKYTSNSSSTSISVPSAFGFTAALGARYYFSTNIGIYAEIGYLSGSILQLGLVAKF
jgi:opacity protein-like surface antigen